VETDKKLKSDCYLILNTFIQFTDVLTKRQCAVRIDIEDTRLTLQQLVYKYLRNSQALDLLRDNRIVRDSIDTFQDIQDFTLTCSTSGLLREPYPGIEFVQDGRPLHWSMHPKITTTSVKNTELSVINIEIDRTNIGYDRNWEGFHNRRWQRRQNEYNDFTNEILRTNYQNNKAERILELKTKWDKVALLHSLARKIWLSEFENYSRFIDRKLIYKTGDETVLNIIAGAGGICSEKVQALKFLTDHYGLDSEYIIAGANVPGPVPESALRKMLDTFDFRFGKRHMKYWQHTALIYHIDGESIFVDATNGNIPFLFIRNADSHPILSTSNKTPVRVKMALEYEDFYYHCVPQDIPEKFIFAMETWISDIDLIQVFENELGLSISSDFFVTPLIYKNQNQYELLSQEYLAIAGKSNLMCSTSPMWSLDSKIGQQFAAQQPNVANNIIEAKNHLLSQYNQWEASEHSIGLVIIKI